MWLEAKGLILLSLRDKTCFQSYHLKVLIHCPKPDSYHCLSSENLLLYIYYLLKENLFGVHYHSPVYKVILLKIPLRYSSDLTPSMKTFITTLATATLMPSVHLTQHRSHFIPFISSLAFQIKSHKSQGRTTTRHHFFVLSALSKATSITLTKMSMANTCRHLFSFALKNLLSQKDYRISYH